MMIAEQKKIDLVSIINNFFLKSATLVCSSKQTAQGGGAQRQYEHDDTWFTNFDEIQGINEIPFENASEWIWSCKDYQSLTSVPPLVIETVLNLRELTENQYIMLRDDDNNLWNVCRGTKKSEIVLERWLIELDSTSEAFVGHKITNPDLQNSTITDICKQLTLLLRYLYTLIQLLPSSELFSTLTSEQSQQAKRLGSSEDKHLLNIATRIIDGSKPILSKGRIGLSKPIISTYSNIVNETNTPPHLEQRKITPVWTQYGLLRISVSYRHDCAFQVDTLERGATKMSSNTLSPHFDSSNMPGYSFSASPHSTAASLDKKKYISRPFQPFKVGSVGSNTAISLHSQQMQKNPSHTSPIAKYPSNSRTSSLSGVHVATGPYNMHGGSASVGSNYRYSSSFDRIRRHSSIKSSDTLERVPKINVQQNSFPSEDILEFVRMLDEKPELSMTSKTNTASTAKGDTQSPININKNYHIPEDLSNSILRFQKFKKTNDAFTEDLSMSVSMASPQVATAVNTSHRRCDSHSPVLSFSPPDNYPSIPSRLYKGSQEGLRVPTSRRNSLERSRQYIPMGPSYGSLSNPKPGQTLQVYPASSSSSYQNGPRGVLDEDRGKQHVKDVEDDLLVSRTTFQRSTSPHSVDSISSALSKNRFPLQHTPHYSQPITAAIPAYGSLQRPSVRSTDVLDVPTKRSSSHVRTDLGETNEEDEDLLFFMSDMNLSKT